MFCRRPGRRESSLSFVANCLSTTGGIVYEGYLPTPAYAQAAPLPTDLFLTYVSGTYDSATKEAYDAEQPGGGCRNYLRLRAANHCGVCSFVPPPNATSGGGGVGASSSSNQVAPCALPRSNSPDPADFTITRPQQRMNVMAFATLVEAQLQARFGGDYETRRAARQTLVSLGMLGGSTDTPDGQYTLNTFTINAAGGDLGGDCSWLAYGAKL